MSLNSNAIITLAEAKTEIKFSSNYEDADAVLEAWINEASDEIERYTGRKFAVQSVTNEIRDGNGTEIIYPLYFPITQLSTETSPTDAQKLAGVQYRDDPDSSWTDIEDDSDHIFIPSDRTTIELYEDVFPLGTQNIRLNYKAGYATVPSDIKRVCFEMVEMRFKESGYGNNLLGERSSSDSMGNRSRSLSIGDMWSRWEKIMNRYRVPSIG